MKGEVRYAARNNQGILRFAHDVINNIVMDVLLKLINNIFAVRSVDIQ